MPADETVARSAHASVGTSAYWIAFSQLWDYVEVLNREDIGGNILYFVVGDEDTAAPTAAGDNTFVVLPQSSVKVRMPFPSTDASDGTTKASAVKLIASGASTDVSVTGFSE